MELAAAWVEEADWRGWVPVPPRQHLLDQHLVMTWVAGANFRIEALSNDCFAPGEPLIIIAEPENPHDPIALGVWSSDGKVQAGYVPRAIAHAFKDPHIKRFGVVLWEDLKNTRRVGLGILLSREPVRLVRKQVSRSEGIRLSRKIQQYRQ